jgi:zinc/manganese transport system ATP-binding protein
VHHAREAFLQQLIYLGHAAALKDDLTPLENLQVATRLGGAAADEAAARQALADAGLRGREHVPSRILSQGQRRRAALARLPLGQALLWVLDEPFNAIDARTTADLLALLQRWRSEQRTVIAVLHDLEQVRSGFDEVLLLAREKVAWGPTAEVLRAEHLFRARQMAEAWDEQAAVCTPGPASRSKGWSAAR